MIWIILRRGGKQLIGKLITFEGGEGCGKTTHIKLLKEYLEGKNIPCYVVREPGGVSISEEIRSIILNPKNTSMDSLTELLLFIAARRQVVSEITKPKLQEGIWVLCDRFIDSTTVYQGICRGIGIPLTEKLNKLAIGDVFPNLTIFLDLDAETSMSRVRDRVEDMSRLDLETIEFYKKVRMGYRELLKHNPKRIFKVVSDRDIEKVFEDIKAIVKNKLLKGAKYK
jgi:dTMP kinase